MINKIKRNRYNYFIKAMALPVLFVIFCAFTLNLNQHAALQQFIGSDTVPAALLSKIKPEDIVSISANKDVVVFTLKNGDSAIARREDFQAIAGKNKKEKPSQFDSLVYEIFNMPVGDLPRDPTDKIFSKLEVEASYPGGPTGWIQYLNKNFNYPIEAMEKKVQGTVMVQFIVDTEGNISNIEAISGPTKGGLRAEAVRTVKNSGKWIPGKQNGIDVRSYKKVPLTFKLESR